MYAEAIQKLKTHRDRVQSLKTTLKVDESRKRIAELDGIMSQEGFWDKRNSEKAQEIIAEKKRLGGDLEPVVALERTVQDLIDLAEMAEAESDPSQLKEIEGEAARIAFQIDKLDLSATLSDKRDPKDAIVSIHPGAGGTESCDWAMMLARMYSRWAERRGFKCAIIDSVAGDETGIKSLTYGMKGKYAYGYLKSEIGVHRLVRISPFDAKKRRHTSFASVDVWPEVGEEVKVEIKDTDLRVETFRSGGAGGQHVNVTDSAVRMIHLPTGIIVQCQNERSQHSNRAMALKLLKARLASIEDEKREAEMAKTYGEKMEVSFGAQIRSYVLHPYKMVKDHRTGAKTGKAEAALDGEIDEFQESFLRWKKMGCPKIADMEEEES